MFWEVQCQFGSICRCREIGSEKIMKRIHKIGEMDLKIMRNRWKVIACIWLAGAIVAATGRLDIHSGKRIDRVYAAPSATATSSPSAGNSGESQNSLLGSAQQKRDQIEQEKRQVEAEVDRIRSFGENVVKYVKTLDAQLNRLMNNIEANKESIKNMQAEVDAVNEEYQSVLERQQEQYNGMKSRIKYMYENSDNSYLQFLLESRSLAELFSREEYIEKVTSYDNSLLSRYQLVLNEVTAAKERAEDKLEQVEATKEALKYEEETMNRLVKEKNRQIKLYQGMLEKGEENLDVYAQQLAAQEAEIERILQSQRTEIANQEADRNNGKPQVVPTSGEYAWPLPVSGRISSPFGYRSSPTAGASTYHKGVDIAVSMGTQILATKDGKVVTATYSSSAGNYVAIYHGGGIYSYYMHCSSLNVSVGDKVKKGQVIARVGSTGISTGPHLHFAIYKGGQYVNPMYYVSQP